MREKENTLTKQEWDALTRVDMGGTDSQPGGSRTYYRAARRAHACQRPDRLAARKAGQAHALACLRLLGSGRGTERARAIVRAAEAAGVLS